MNKPAKTNLNFIFKNEKDFLLHRIFYDLSSSNNKKDYVPIKRIKSPNLGIFDGKRSKSNGTSRNAHEIAFNERKFLFTHQLFVGPMKENEPKTERNEELAVKKVKLSNETKRKTFKKNDFAKDKAKETILSFFNENLAKMNKMKESKTQEKLPRIHHTPAFKPYKEQAIYIKTNSHKSPNNKPMNLVENNEKTKKNYKITNFFKEIDECGCWTIKSSVSIKFPEEI